MNSFGEKCSLLGIILIVFFFLWIPASFGRDPAQQVSKFALEIEGKAAGYFLSVTGIGSENEIITHREMDQNGNEITRKIPGRLEWSNISLSQGFSSNLDINDWRQLVIDGRIDEARINFSIIAYNEANEEIARWSFTNGWPSKISTSQDIVSDLTTFYLIENLTIAHEGYSRVQ